MNNIKFIYADLQRSHVTENEIRLDTFGTQQDLKRHGIVFREGETYWFWRDDEINDPLIFSAKVRFDKDLEKWIANVDPTTIKHLSESQFAGEYSPEDIEGGDIVK